MTKQLLNQSLLNKILEIEEIELDGRMYVRSTRFENSIFYPEIGSRKGKYYFLVEEKAPKKTKFLLSMIPIGSTFFNVVNNDTKINLLQKLILKIQVKTKRYFKNNFLSLIQIIASFYIICSICRI